MSGEDARTSTEDAGTGTDDGLGTDGRPDRVAVVGGGAVGVTAAHDLAAAGVDVTLYERDDALGDDRTRPRERIEGSSRRAAGVVRSAFEKPHDAQLAERSVERFRDLSGTGGFRFHDCPQFTVVREGDEDRAAALRESVATMREQDCAVELVAPDSLPEPLVGEDVAVAARADDAGWVAPGPGAYVAAMANRARNVGADIRIDTAATIDLTDDGPRVNGEQVDAVIVAAGAWTKAVLADAGILAPLKPYRVQALVSRTGYDGPMVHDATAGCYFRPHPEGLLAGDGTVPAEVDPDDWEPAADDWFVEETATILRERASHDPDVAAAWAGLCVATPDGDPLLGEVADGVHVAAGWQGHGFMRAPATGEAVAEAVLGEGGVPVFAPDRFDGDESFEVVEGMDL